MGNSKSYALPDVERVPLDKPVVAFSQHYCYDEPLILQHSSGSLSSTRRFRNVHTDAVAFTAKQLSLLSSRLTLLDDKDVAVANFRRKTFSSKPIYYVRPGSDHDCDETFQVKVQYDEDDETEVRLKFTDLVTREPCKLSFEGHWRKRTAYFWLERGNPGVRTPVAKVYCPDGVSKSKYHVAIEPNMDAALIVMVCVIMAKQQSKEEDAEIDEVIDEVIDSALG